MTDLELAWLAGYLEGEGCFVYGKRESPSVKVAATDADVVQRAAGLMGVHKVWAWPKPNPRHKPVFEAAVRGEAALELMRVLRPHMGTRRAARIREVLQLSAARLGRPYGDRHANTKLRDDDVGEVRALAAAGVPRRELAVKYGVSRALIQAVVTGNRRIHNTPLIATPA